MNYPSYLMHYGVKGQHWGERQYQYMDGTYTPLGKERRRIGLHDYGSKSGVTSSSSKSSKSASPKQKAEKIKNMDILTERNYEKYLKYNKKTESFEFDYGDLSNKQKKRLLDAVDNGIDALDRIRGVGGYDDDGVIDDNLRSWFVFEDQTIGLTTISDMVNQGYSKKEIVNTINEASELPYEYAYDDKIFQLRENGPDRLGKYYNEDFIDACIEIRDEQKLKHALKIKLSEIL